MFALGALLAPEVETRFRCELLPRVLGVRIFRDGKRQSIAVCDVAPYGDRATMFGIQGNEFYEAMAEPGFLADLCRRLNVKTLAGYVTAGHARLMVRSLTDVAKVKTDGEGRGPNGERMVWVIVRPT